MQTHWLAQTKLVPPRLRGDFITRERLHARLNEAIRAHPLTVLSAPAGYGKTTLLASLPAVSPGLPLAWISLGEEDNDPARFLAVLIEALRLLNPDIGLNAQALLENAPGLSDDPRWAVAMLVNEILSGFDDFWVVLDDLHLISEPAVYRLLDHLLERLPPPMHLIIATRYDPPLALARLRARGLVAELRVSELRFNIEETRAFLNENQRLNLTDGEVAELQDRAEGWAAGLRLLAASLDHLPASGDRAAYIHTFAHDERYIFDFLAEEVLNQQAPEVRAFLLDTCVLEELNPSLCNALTGKTDAHIILDTLSRRSLFLSQVGKTGEVFRYHALFAKFLSQQLRSENPGRYLDLHRRAAEAQAADAPARAVRHYLAAGLWAEAAQAIDQASEDFMQQGLLQTLGSWIGALPEKARSERPRLLYLLSLWSLQRGALNEASAYAEEALRRYRASGDAAGQRESLLLMVDVASRLHDYERQKLLIQHFEPFTLPVHGEVQLLVAQVWQGIFQRETNQADEALVKAIHLTLDSNNLRALHVLAPLLNSPVAFLPSGPEQLGRFCREALARFGHGAGIIQASAHCLQGYLHFLHGSLEDASQAAEQAMALLQQAGSLAYKEVDTRYVLGTLMAVRGDFERSERYWEGFLPYLQQTPSIRPYVAAFLSLTGRAQWMQGKFDQARLSASRVAAAAGYEEFPEVVLSRLLMQAFVAIHERDYGEAERVLSQAIRIEQQWAHAAMFGSARVLMAYMHLQRRREQDAWLHFAPFLAECERKNIPGLVLQETKLAVPLLRMAVERKRHQKFAQTLLEQLDAARAVETVTIPETGQTLTPREVEVLRLIVNGASNQEIARRLVISEHTVKAHITSLYTKMQVASRVQAASRARELGVA